MQVDQFVMAYGVEQDRLRALLPEGFSSLWPVLRLNAEVRDGKTGYMECLKQDDEPHITFKLPEAADREAVLSFYTEIEQSGGVCIGIGNYRDYDRWLTGMQNRHTGESLPEGYVRENFYLCYADERLIGVFSLKFELTEYLVNFGGHIGYAVRPSDRNCGFATRMLRQGLELAKRFGFASVLCVCDEDNAASEAVILKNGGVLEDERFNPEEQVMVRCYWIAL